MLVLPFLHHQMGAKLLEKLTEFKWIYSRLFQVPEILNTILRNMKSVNTYFVIFNPNYANSCVYKEIKSENWGSQAALVFTAPMYYAEERIPLRR